MFGEIEMKIVLDGAELPTLAHEKDAGFDLYAREAKIVPARGATIFDTGVHIELPSICLSNGLFPMEFKTVGFLKSKSGLNIKHGIMSEGVIDMGYTGSIRVKLYNNSDIDYKVNKGDKISQLVILPVITPKLTVVDSLDVTERGDNGFGSTGR